MTEELPRQVTTSTDVICQELDGEMVILDLRQEQYFGLNDVGTRLWQLMTAGRNTDEILKTLLSEFDVDEATLKSDISALIQQLAERQPGQAGRIESHESEYSVMGRWNSFRRLKRADRQQLLLMSLILPIIAGAVRCLGFRRVFSIIGRLAKQRDIDTMPEDVLIKRVRKLTRYIKLKGFYRGNCLSRSLMIWLLLRRNGICCDLVVGSRFRNGGFQAHAWVEYAALPLNANRHVRQRYVVFDHNFEPDGSMRSLTN